MTSLTKNMMLAAASLLVAAGVASAQEVAKADIPFTFRAGGAVLPAGTYNLYLKSSGSPVFVLRNHDSGHSILAMSQARIGSYGATANGDPRLVFECGAGRCALIQLWGGSGAPGYAFSQPKLGKDQASQLAVIRLQLERAQ